MEEFKVRFARAAEKAINKLEPKTRIAVLHAIKGLEAYPFPKGDTIKKLKGAKIPLYRLRIGDFRVVYHINGKKVITLFVADRKDLEKKLAALS